MSRRLILLLAVAVALFTLAPAVGAGNANGAFTANLQAENETADVDSDATGEAILKVTGDSVSFKLIVANIDNVTQAHIHCGAEGADGPPDVFLFGPAFADPVTTNGILDQGTITADDFLGNCGWVTVNDLVAAIEAGNAYVNVHTTEFAPGEIRGQLS